MPTRWLPYALLPSAPEVGRPTSEILELRLPAGESDWAAAFRAERVETVQVWPLDAVLKNFALRAALWHIAASEYGSGTRKARTTLGELERWADHTRALADRLPFAGPLKGMMETAAARMVQDLEWRAQFFTRWPTSIETKADADWRVSLNLWGADQLFRAVNEHELQYARHRQQQGAASVEYMAIAPTQFWPAMFDWCPPDRLAAAFADYTEAQKRVTRLEKRIKPEARDALMVSLLRDVLQNGHFRPGEPAPSSLR